MIIEIVLMTNYSITHAIFNKDFIIKKILAANRIGR